MNNSKCIDYSSAVIPAMGFCKTLGFLTSNHLDTTISIYSLRFFRRLICMPDKAKQNTMNKIKVILVTTFLMAVSASAFSQAQIGIGLKGGLNFANLNTSDFEGTFKSRTGYHFGAFALIKLTKIGIQPEIIFSQQGSKVKSPDLGSVEANFSYMNIPIMLKLYTVAGINLQVGPQFGFLTSADIGDEDYKEEMKGSDISIGVGAGWDLPFGLSIDGRYNFGVKNVSDASGAEIKNQVWQVSLGYKIFKLGN